MIADPTHDPQRPVKNNAPPAEPLDLVDFPLVGRSLIEAAAGTGKTYSLVRIVLRAVVERGVELSRILITTFTRAATAELRLRIEAILVDAQHAFANLALGNRDAVDADPVLRAIAERVSATEALTRVERARLDLDDAAIFTLHGLCQRVLAREGFTTPLGPPRAVGARPLGDIEQAVADHYRRQRNREDFGFLSCLGQSPQDFVAAYRAAIERPIPLADADPPTDPTPVVDAWRRAWTSGERAVFQDALVDNRRNERTLRLWQRHLATLDRIATEPFERWRADLATPTSPIAQVLAEKGLREDWSKNIPKTSRGRLPPHLDKNAKTITLGSALPNTQSALEACRAWRDQQLRRVLVETIRAVRQALERQRDVSGRLAFDDLVVALRDALRTPEGHRLAARLRTRYPVALIDEFQDTDPLQFEILERIYWPSGSGTPKGLPDAAPRGLVGATPEDMTGDVALILIGDPKQAIYRFRGGDLPTYRRAAFRVDRRFAMTTNYRSHPAVVAGYNALFDTAHLGDPTHSPLGEGIACPPVAAGTQPARRLTDPDWDAGAEPAQVASGLDASDAAGVDWVILPYDETLPGANRKAGAKPSLAYGAKVRTALARWTALEVVRLLTKTRWAASGVADEDAAQATETPLRPRDIAILVRDRTEAGPVLTALRELGVPCVYGSDRTLVFDSDEAAELETVLDGILHLEQPARLHAAAIGHLLGISPVALARALDVGARPATDPSARDDATPAFDYAAWLDSIVALRERWRRDGVLALGMGLLQQHARPPAERLERFTTNVLHLLELLADDPVARTSPEATLDALRRARAGFGQSADAEALEQRLDSEADRVRVLTLHKSKGLEYPIVFLPFAGVAKDTSSQGAAFDFVLERHHDGQLRLGAYASGDPRLSAEQQEGNAEAVRLLYVGATRAIQRLVIPLSPHNGFVASLLGRLWAVQHPDSAVFRLNDVWPDAIQQHLDALRSAYDACLTSRPAPAPPSRRWRVTTLAPDMRAAIGARWQDTAAGLRNAPGRYLSTSHDVADDGFDDAGASLTPLVARRLPVDRPNPAFDRWRIHSFSAWTRSLHQSPLTDRIAGLTTGTPPISTVAPDHGDAADGLLIDDTPRDRDQGTDEEPLMTPPPATFVDERNATDTLTSRQTALANARLSDAPRAAGDPTTAVDAFTPLPSARLVLRGGADAGNFLHDLFEGLDFPAAAGDFRTLQTAIENLAVRYPLQSGLALKSDGFSAWLSEVLATPLPSGARLAELDRAATLRECEFHFALDAPHAEQGSTLVDVLRGHRARHAAGDASVATHPAPASDLAWLSVTLPSTLEGLLHGYIDLIYLHNDRFHIVDYKSTRLGSHFEDYHPERLRRDVEANAYDLQYLLYSLALHRYLRARLSDYAPERHLGGVEYLYLRGMNEQGDAGIFHRPIDVAAVRALDALFGAPIEVDAPASTEALA